MSDLPATDIAAAYDRWAASYDGDRNKTRELAAVVLREANLSIAGCAVVEIGCGTGHNTVWLAERASSLVALDFSEGMLRQARTRVRRPHVQFIRHDLRLAWPVPSDSADLVIAMLVFEHIERLDPVFAEAAQCLRPGGELFLSELHPARQRTGRRAEFVDPVTGEPEQIAAVLHEMSEFVTAAIRAGFELDWTDVRRDAVARPDTLPRLFSALFRRGS